MDDAADRYRQMMELVAIRTLVELKILDVLPVDQGSTLEQLSVRSSIAEPLLARLLRMAVSIGLLRYDASTSCYCGTATSLGYRSDGDAARLFQLMYSEGLHTGTFLPAWIQKRGQHKETLGFDSYWSNPSSFRERKEGMPPVDIMVADPARLQDVNAGLAAIDTLQPFNEFFDFERILQNFCKRNLLQQSYLLVDIGGGDGQFLASLLQSYPWIDPKTLAIQDFCDSLDAAKGRLPSQIRFQEHDLFKPQTIRGAFVYHMRACLHDYNDELCVRILTQIANAMAPDSTLLIAENVMPDLPSPFEPVAYMDLLMMLVGGKERTREDFRCLLERSGLVLEAVHFARDVKWAVLEARLKLSLRLKTRYTIL